MTYLGARDALTRALALIEGEADQDTALDHLIGSLESRYGKGDYANRWREVTGSDNQVDWATERFVVQCLIYRQLYGPPEAAELPARPKPTERRTRNELPN